MSSEYWKAVRANNFAIAGYAAMGLGVLGGSLLYASTAMGLVDPGTIKDLHLDNIAVLTGVSGLVFSVWLGFGMDTLDDYRHARERIQEQGTIDSTLGEVYSTAPYCNATGIRLAAREAGLAHTLPKRKTFIIRSEHLTLRDVI